MMELLHGAGVRLGLVTNGERWMLVQAPRGETTGFASWYASLWAEEPLTLRAFRSLLSARRFFGVPDGETIEALLIESARDQHEVTEQLGIPTGSWEFEPFGGFLSIEQRDVTAVVGAVLLVAALLLFLNKSKMGRAIRALGDDHQAALSVGISLSTI